MTPPTQNQAASAKSIFLLALDIDSEVERQRFVVEACRGDVELAEDVQRLLAHRDQAGSFLESPVLAIDLAATVDQPSHPHPGTQIGLYKIRQQIGDGGMGVVYFAEQERPLRRKVALKVIKPGMDSKAVLGRFEAERNALAMMNHPNIAKVLDAGTTDQGRPYFVMELVNGAPITEYCDNQKLAIRERLKLFVDVCAAIQHAHQKGVIHRDIKPSNVLVTELDGKPIAKVIDFGVAKALNQSLTEQSLFTAFQTVIGTPLYMSPEQASFSAVDVDTRSDVYSLGVLLYELLTGTTPFTNDDLKQAAQEEIFKYIREQEPPRPSNRISSLGETATKISQLRRTQPDQLGRTVKGDLDWIVMKALSKERGRRYRSADEFSEDIGRHLLDRPIMARPPTFRYLAGRFAKRNTASMVIATTILAMGGALFGGAILKYRNETALADNWRESVFDSSMLRIMSGDDPRELISQARSVPIPAYQIHLLEGQAALYGGDPDTAIVHLKSALDLKPDDVCGKAMLGVAHYHAGNLFDGVVKREEAIEGLSGNAKPRELLFLAHAKFIESAEAIRDINSYLDQVHSPVGLLVRADLRAWHANYHADASGIGEALLDIQAANRLLGETAYALAVELWVRTQVMRFESQHRIDANENRNLAKAIERRLAERYPDYVWGNFLRSCYWDYKGDLQNASRAWMSSKNWRDNSWCRTGVALTYYRQGNSDLALKTCAQLESIPFRLLAAPMFLESEEGRKLAWDTFEEAERLALTDISNSGRVLRYHFLFDVPILLGELERARALAQKILHDFPINNKDSHWERLNYELMRFIAQQSTPEQLLERCPNEGMQVFAHYYIGLMRLADGDRDGARESFEIAHADGNYYFSTQMGDGFAHRIMKDPEWPRWLER